MQKTFIFAIIMLIAFIVFNGCSSRPQSVKDRQLVSKYQQLIGCVNYNQLKPAKEDFTEVKQKCVKDYESVDPYKEFIKAIVYRGLNADILFVHLTYKSEKQQRDAVNYIYSVKRDEIAGFYRCY